MFDYETEIKDSASYIFLNFYKVQNIESIVLTNEDTHDLIEQISIDHNIQVLSVEKDIAKEMKNILKRIPPHILNSPTETIH